jgi:hypothetical protein
MKVFDGFWGFWPELFKINIRCPMGRKAGRQEGTKARSGKVKAKAFSRNAHRAAVGFGWIMWHPPPISLAPLDWKKIEE